MINLREWLFGYNKIVIERNKRAMFSRCKGASKGAFGGKNSFSFSNRRKK